MPQMVGECTQRALLVGGVSLYIYMESSTQAEVGPNRGKA